MENVVQEKPSKEMLTAELYVLRAKKTPLENNQFNKLLSVINRQIITEEEYALLVGILAEKIKLRLILDQAIPT